jgi:hypothetical protein
VRHAFGAIEMVEGGDGIPGAIGGSLGLCDRKRVAEDDGRSERVLGRGVKELRCPVLEISQRGAGTAVPDEKFEGVEFESGLRMRTEEPLEGANALRCVWLLGGGAEVRLLGVRLCGERHIDGDGKNHAK